jgi:HemY protein
MLRILVFLAVVLAAALGFAWLADTPGSVTLTWGGAEYRVSLLVATGLLIAFIAAVMALVALARATLRLPAWLAFWSRIIAVGTGDTRGARRNADEARRLLGQEPLAMLLTAQAAQLAGDRAGAEGAFSTMLEHAETRVLGLRGLFIEAQRRGDMKAGRFYAEEAYKLAPSVPWVGDAVLDFRCSELDWRGALAIVEQNASRRLIDKGTARRQRAVLLTAEGLERADHEPDTALKDMLEALKLEPGLVPAAAYAGRRIAEKGDYGRASKLLETAWKLSPHPDIAEAYLDVRPGDSALDRLKRAKHLLKLQPGAAEGRLAVARAALDAREFSTAREALEMLLLDRPTVRACTMMAALEEEESGNMGLVREWLSRASRAERDNAWVADGVVSDTWRPLSPVTGKLDAFVWTTPPQMSGALLRAEIEADKVIADHHERETPPMIEATVVKPNGAEPPSVATPVVEPQPRPSEAPPPEAKRPEPVNAAAVPAA